MAYQVEFNTQMTRSQERTLLYIDWHQAKHGYPPSVRDIQEGTDRASPASVQHTLEALIALGFVRRTALRARTVTLTPAGQQIVGRLWVGEGNRP